MKIFKVRECHYIARIFLIFLSFSFLFFSSLSHSLLFLFDSLSILKRFDIFLLFVDPISISLQRLLFVRYFRPDRLIFSIQQFIDSVFSGMTYNISDLNLKSIVFEEVQASTPIIFCSTERHDASHKVETFSAEVSVKLISIAMGSPEGYTLADNAITTAIRTGSWVLLKNVHLAISWLSSLEKKLQGFNPNKGFRLFLTMQTDTKVPVNLLRLSRILVFEPTPGIKANLIHSLQGIPESKVSKVPLERSRLYFLSAWLHSVIQERLRYVPLGWTKQYEFNDADYECALEMIDYWLEKVTQNRSNISPDKIPWEALRTLLKQTIYGGKIDGVVDQRLLNSFVDNLFNQSAFDIGYSLQGKDKEDSSVLKIPEGNRMSQFIDWISALPDYQSPTWLGLPSNAEELLNIKKGI